MWRVVCHPNGSNPAHLSAESLLDQHSGGGAVASAVQREPDKGAPGAHVHRDDAVQLIHLLGSTVPGVGGDPVATYLNGLDTPALLAALGGAVDGGCASQLHARLATARPLLVAALYAAELARIGPVAPTHPLLQGAGVALDRVSRDQQLQILGYLLHRRAVSVEATTLVEGALAMREGADHGKVAASQEQQPTGAGRGAADAAGIPAAGDDEVASAVIGASVAGGAAGPAPINPGPWTPPGNQPGGWYIGSGAHTAIAGFYLAAHPGDLVFTNNTPLSTILTSLTRMANKGASADASALAQDELARRPDIANMSRRHLYEIKPAAAQAEASAKARMYLDIFQKAGIEMTLGSPIEPGTSGGLPAFCSLSQRRSDAGGGSCNRSRHSKGRRS